MLALKLGYIKKKMFIPFSTNINSLGQTEPKMMMMMMIISIISLLL